MKTRKSLFVFFVMLVTSCALPNSPIEPPIQLGILGHFNFGMSTARLENDNQLNIILANGGDWSPQPMTMQLLGGAEFVPGIQNEPIWYSQKFMHYFGVDLGDTDGDNFLDLYAAVMAGPLRDKQAGGIYKYSGIKGERGQGFDVDGVQITDAFGASDLKLADLDADGDLDLVATAMTNSNGTQGNPRVYLNSGGSFPAQADWISKKAVGGRSLALADLDDDGFLDLVVRSDTLDIFFGRQVSGGMVPFDDTRHVLIVDDEGNAAVELAWKVDTGPIGESAEVALVSANSNGYSVYKISPNQTDIIWSDATAEFAFSVAIVDVTGDGLSDLITSPFAIASSPGQECVMQNPLDPNSCIGGPVQIRRGTRSSFSKLPLSSPNPPSTIAEEITPFENEESCIKSGAIIQTKNHPLSVVSFPTTGVQEITSVSIAGSSTTNYQFSLEDNWLTLWPPVEANKEVKVGYKFSNNPGLLLATGAPQQGVWVMHNAMDCSNNSEK